MIDIFNFCGNLKLLEKNQGFFEESVMLISFVYLGDQKGKWHCRFPCSKLNMGILTIT